jgi:hypothetical protein
VSGLPSAQHSHRHVRPARDIRHAHPFAALTLEKSHCRAHGHAAQTGAIDQRSLAVQPPAAGQTLLDDRGVERFGSWVLAGTLPRLTRRSAAARSNDLLVIRRPKTPYGGAQKPTATLA